MNGQSYHSTLRSCSMSLELSDSVGHTRKGCPQKATGGSEDSICLGLWFEQLHREV